MKTFLLSIVAVSATAYSMPAQSELQLITAQQVIQRIVEHAAVPRPTPTVDTFKAGDSSTVVRGVAVTMMATLDVLRRAKLSGSNLVITHEPTFYGHRDETAVLAKENDAVFAAKQKFVVDNGLVVWRFHDLPHLMKPDMIATGVIRALGWESKRESATSNIYLPGEMSIEALASMIGRRLNAPAVRVMGAPGARVSRAAITFGFPGFQSNRHALQGSRADVIVMGEDHEWETIEYVADAINAGQLKGAIVVGHIPSEQAGMEDAAKWIRTFVKEVPVNFIPTIDPFARPVSNTATPSGIDGDFLYAWSASADTTRQGAFLAIFDLRDGSPTRGRVIDALYAGAGTQGTHHSEASLQSDRLLFADDFGAGKSFVFDLKNPLAPRVHSTFTTAGPFGWPHSYVRLPSGNRLVTYQFQSTKFNRPPGGLAEVKTDGSIVRWANATTAGIDDKEITPYSLEVIPAMDRVVTTTTSMIEDTGVGLQVWSLSDLRLLHTLKLPGDSPQSMHSMHAGSGMNAADTMPHHLFPGEPRLLADGKTVMLATFTCGLYTLSRIDTKTPVVKPVYTFPGKNCAVPVVIGKYWLQTVPDAHAVMVLDVSRPDAPREISRIEIAGTAPHWLAANAAGDRLVVNNGSRTDSRLFLLRFDKRTGMISIDKRYPPLNLDSVNVPGLGVVKGIPHGTVFSR